MKKIVNLRKDKLRQPRICLVTIPFTTSDPNAYVHAVNLLRVLKPLAEEIITITDNFPENTVNSEKFGSLIYGIEKIYKDATNEVIR